MRITIFLFIISLLAACSTDNSEPTGLVGFTSDDALFPTVTPELRPFYIAFEQEAAERGLDIDLTIEGVTGNIVQLGNNSVLGLCRRSGVEPNRVAVDIEAWNNSTPAFREVIVFHELGHCVLDRGHLDEQENGACLSIMHSGLTDCIVDLEDADIREQYLDELFSF
jgi:hypothetical protein